MNIKSKSKFVKEKIPAIFLSIKDKDTPLIAKILSIVIVVYALSPIDIIPDFVPILGYIDELIILPILIGIVIKLIPHDVFQKNVEKAKKLVLAKKWIYSIPIIIIWGLILYLIYKTFFKGEYYE